jgi:hypothetical protein
VADIFISYATANRDDADAVHDLLRAAGYSAWLAHRENKGGEHWPTKIATAVSECRVFVLLYSQTAAASTNVRAELDQAWEDKKPILPIVLDDHPRSGSFKLFLNGAHWIDVSTISIQSARFQIITSIQTHLGKPDEPTASASVSIRAAKPYVVATTIQQPSRLQPPTTRTLDSNLITTRHVQKAHLAKAESSTLHPPYVEPQASTSTRPAKGCIASVFALAFLAGIAYLVSGAMGFSSGFSHSKLGLGLIAVSLVGTLICSSFSRRSAHDERAPSR